MAVLTHDPLDPAAVAATLANPGRGAVVTFAGVVRNHHMGRAVVGLEYTAYEPMAAREIGAIIAEAEAADDVGVAVVHRLGPLVPGDVAVVVAVAAAHRDAAFRVCREVLDAVKARVPIWKRERHPDGTESWVDPSAAGGTVPAGRPA